MIGSYRAQLLRHLLLGLVCVLAPFATAQGKSLGAKPGKAIDIVFVGNSYTFFHDLPACVRALGAADQPARKVTTTMLAPGGCTWQGHWTTQGEQAPRTVLEKQKPDFVVLQEQSHMAIDDAKQMQEFAGKFAALAKKLKVTPVWYMTWARKAEPAAQDKITEQYTKAQQDGGGLLAPVGRAWQLVRKDHADLELFMDDGSHPSPNGTYLAACVLYVTMCGGDVAKFPDKLVQTAADGKEHVLIELTPELGKQLRAAAAAVLTVPAAKTKQKQ